MHLRIGLICLFTLGMQLCEAQSSFSIEQDTLVISTHRLKGFGPFRSPYTYLSANGRRPDIPWEVAYPTYTLPEGDDTLMNQFVSTDLILSDISMYQAQQTKGVDSAYYARVMGRTSLKEGDFYMDPPAPVLSLLIGQDSTEQLYYRYDGDGDHDFTDEEWKPVLSEKMAEEKGQEASVQIPHLIEWKRHGKLRQDTIWFTIIPGEIPFDIGYPVVFFNMPEHRIADFTLDGTPYKLGLSNGGTSWTYEYPDLVVVDEQGKAGEGFEPGDYLKLGDQAYKFVTCDMVGETITLVREDNFANLEGRQVGMRAVKFAEMSMQGEKVSLEDYKGKYVYLDFWGTWCGPCVQEVPTVKKTYELFKDDDFAIIGIALDDSASLADFIAAKEMPWPQILQENDRDPSNILGRYKISGYPTTFLINPEGRVEERGLRGDGLITYLAKKFPLSDEDAAILLDGAQHFSLTGYGEAKSVSATLYDEVGEEYDVPMFPINGRWAGSADLEPGTYTYVFEADKETMVDPNAKETREVDGEARSVMKVE